MRNGPLAVLVILLVIVEVASFAVTFAAYRRLQASAKRAGREAESFREVYAFAIREMPDAPDTLRMGRGFAAVAAATLTLLLLGIFYGRR